LLSVIWLQFKAFSVSC